MADEKTSTTISTTISTTTDTAADEAQPTQTQKFEQQADEAQPGLMAEFVEFLLHNKKWWLTPIILVLLAVLALVALGSTGVAPFIYPML